MSTATQPSNCIPDSVHPTISDLSSIFSTLTIENDHPDGVQQRRRGVVARTVRRWLRKLGFNWRDIKQGVYTDGHEREDVCLYRRGFIERLEYYWPRVVEFNDDGSIIDKDYPAGVTINATNPDMRPLILITHDESIFQSNDGHHQAWIHKGHHFIRPKGRGQGIMVSDLLLPWSRLTASSISLERRSELGLPEHASILFEYGREAGHWKGKDLVEQLTKIAIPMAEAVYPGYQFLFLFDNSSNHGLFARDALRAQNLNLTSGGEQAFLRDGYYTTENGMKTSQPMWYYKTTAEIVETSADQWAEGARENVDGIGRRVTGLNAYQVQSGETSTSGSQTGLALDSAGNGLVELAMAMSLERVQKGLQRVLEEQGLWPASGLRLECPKNLCEKCSAVKNCRLCVSRHKCTECKKKKICSGPCSRRRKCDKCERRRTCQQCTTRERCTRCTEYGSCRHCITCSNMPARCSSKGTNLSSYLNY